MEIWAARIDAVDPSLAERLIGGLPPDMQGKVRRYRHEDDRLRSLTGGMLAQVYAAERWGLFGKRFAPIRSRYEKPILVGHPFHYNVSHSGVWVVSAFAEHAAVGIDVEKIRPIDIELSDCFFSKKETFNLRLQPEPLQLSYFYKLWTLKESYIKAKGEGLSIPLDTFSFVLNEERIDFQSTGDSGNWYFCQYDLDEGYETAICASRREFPEHIEIVAWLDLAERFQRAVSG